MAKGIRRPPGRHGGRFVGKWTSTKTGETMWWESSGERAHLRPLEWDPSVLYYVTQPLTLRWIQDGAVRRWTPDILRVTTSRTLVEVKPYERTLTEEFRMWAAAAGNAAVAKGYEFQVWTERDLPAEPRRSNIDLLMRYRHEIVPASVEEAVSGCLRNNGPLPLAEVLKQVGGERGIPTIYCLMVRHSVGYDIDQPIGLATTLRLPHDQRSNS